MLKDACDSNVCAVGAILRDHALPSLSVFEYYTACGYSRAYDADSDPDNETKAEYFNDLVGFFDLTVKGSGFRVSAADRFRIANYIHDRFPDNVRIETSAPGLCQEKWR